MGISDWRKLMPPVAWVTTDPLPPPASATGETPDVAPTTSGAVASGLVVPCTPERS